MLFTLSSSCVYDDRKYETKQTDSLTKKFAEQMQVYGLRPMGIGSAERNGKTTSFSVVFSINEVLDKDAARRLIVTCTNDFINLLNTSKENYFFAKIPADLSMINISIIAKPANNTDDYLFSVFVLDGKIIYNYDNESLEIKNIFNSERETFEEAERIVNEQNGSTH